MPELACAHDFVTSTEQLDITNVYALESITN